MTMNRLINNSIILTLGIILITQSIFLPFAVSALFAVVIIILYFKLAKQEKRISKVITFLFVIVSLAAIFFSYKTFIGIEAGVAVLATFLFAKAMEIKAKRDVIILLNFALFVSASSFLYSQSLWMALLVISCLLSCLVGLYRLQTSEFSNHQISKISIFQDARHVGKFIVFALPFFILLFLFFPRLPPLWHIPIPDQNKGITGISETMSPGDIAELSQSSELAFRIIGDMKKLPNQSDLYWRGLVLDQYDGQQWTSNFANQQPSLNAHFEKSSQNFEYEYLAADVRTKWVMSLEKSVPIQEKYVLRTDWSVVPIRPNGRIQPVKMQWIGKAQFNLNVNVVPNWVQSSNTRAPTQFDLQAQQFAQNLFVKSNRNPELYIQNLLKWYKENNFTYTLSPGLLGQNRIDEFLFKSKQGFCEHYASSFVMLMRYVGIPARIVVGYQGGQLAPDSESWEVRQLDAHAWTEVLIGQEWIRYDPTAIIAPERVDRGMQNLIANNQQVFGGSHTSWKYQQFNFLNKARIWSDYLTYQWQSKVVGYDVQSQKKWFDRLGFSNTYTAILVLIFGILLIVSAYFSWIYYLTFKCRDKVQLTLNRLSKQLPIHLQKKPYESVASWLICVSSALELNEHEQALICELINSYQKYVYGANKDEKDIQILLKLINSCSAMLAQYKKGLS